jgi:putative membrane protein
MKSANRIFDTAQKDAIEQAIATAEEMTSGEIVPVVASHSGHYHHANMVVGFLCALIAVIILWCFAEVKHPAIWNGEHSLTVGLPIILFVEIAAFFVGILLARFIPHLKLFFISTKEMQMAVESKAREVFFNLHISNTQASTGIVIYVSLFEHIVYVQGDAAISEKLSQDEWNHIRNIIIQDVKQNKLDQGLKKAILETGVLLGKHFPNNNLNENELPNKLHLLG